MLSTILLSFRDSHSFSPHRPFPSGRMSSSPFHVRTSDGEPSFAATPLWCRSQDPRRTPDGSYYHIPLGAPGHFHTFRAPWKGAPPRRSLPSKMEAHFFAPSGPHDRGGKAPSRSHKSSPSVLRSEAEVMCAAPKAWRGRNEQMLSPLPRLFENIFHRFFF